MDDGGDSVRRTTSAADICFNCKERGHWYKDCPSTRSPPSRPGADTPVDAHNLPVVQCPCCGGICPVRTSTTAKNPGRKFYSCSCGPQKGKLSFFEWADTMSSQESEVPFCSCGAARCSVVTKTTGPNAGRRYFACRVPKGQGACPFFQWEDAKLNGTLDNDVGGSKHSDPFPTRNDQEVTCTVNVDLDEGKHDNAVQSKGNNCKVSHTARVVSSSRKHTNGPQSKENDFEVTRSVNVDLGEDKHNDTLLSARSCEVTHTIYVDLGREKHANAFQPEGRDCEATDIVNVDLSEDKHVTTLMSARSYEVTPTINAELERCERGNAPKCKENGNKVTHIVNDVLVEDKFANAPQSAGNKHEVTHTLGGDEHADTPQYYYEGTHGINVDLGEGKYDSSPTSAELCHTTVDLGFEHSKRMRSDLPLMSNDLYSREYKLGYEHSKRMRKDLSMMSNQYCIPFAEVNLPPADSSKPSEPSETFSPSENYSGLQFVMPKISNSLDLVDADIVHNGDSCISIMSKESRGSCLSPSELELSRQIYATRDGKTGDLIVFIQEIFGFHAVGWLGRLVFLPRGFMTLPPPKPFFYGISPSFSAITVPEPMKQSDTAGSIVRPQSPHTQHEKQCVTYRDSQLISDHKETSAQQETVKSFRSNLVTLLKSMDPQDHKYMERVANPILLDALDHLSADNSHLRKRVEEFICCASALAQAKCTSEIEPSSEDLIGLYNNEKSWLDQVIGEHAEAVDAFEASKEVCSLLRKEASRVKKMLVEIETRLSCSEVETLKLQARFQETCEAKKKCEITLQSIEEKLEVRLREEDELLVAKEAFKKAKNQLLL